MTSTSDSSTRALPTSLTNGLDQVEDMLRTSLESDFPFVTSAVATPRRRRRQALSSPLGAAGVRSSETLSASGVVPSAVVVELTHLATLYHDDVMDEAELRAVRRRRTPVGTTPSRS